MKKIISNPPLKIDELNILFAEKYKLINQHKESLIQIIKNNNKNKEKISINEIIDGKINIAQRAWFCGLKKTLQEEIQKLISAMQSELKLLDDKAASQPYFYPTITFSPKKFIQHGFVAQLTNSQIKSVA